MHSTLLGGGHEVHGHLVVVREQLVLLHVHAAVVAHCYARLVVAEDLVLFYLGEGGARADDARPLVLMNLVVTHVRARVKHYDTVTIIVDVIVLYPAEPTLYAKDTLTPRLVDQVVQDHSVSRVGPSVGYIRFIVPVNLILLDVRTPRVHQ